MTDKRIANETERLDIKRFEILCSPQFKVAGFGIRSAPQKMTVDVFPDGHWRCHIYSSEAVDLLFDVMLTRELLDATKKRIPKKRIG
jgi:hypothetical protein